MKIKNNSIIRNKKTSSQFKSKYEISEEYWKEREKECEKNLSKFC